MISRIIKVEVGVISRSQRLRLITLTKTLIILDITKTEFNDCFISSFATFVDLFVFVTPLSSTTFSTSCSVNEANLEVMFLLLH